MGIEHWAGVVFSPFFTLGWCSSPLLNDFCIVGALALGSSTFLAAAHSFFG